MTARDDLGRQPDRILPVRTAPPLRRCARSPRGPSKDQALFLAALFSSPWGAAVERGRDARARLPGPRRAPGGLSGPSLASTDGLAQRRGGG